MPDDTYMIRFLDDYAEEIIVSQLIKESDYEDYDKESAKAAIDSMISDREWDVLASIYERATGYNPYSHKIDRH